MPLALQYTVTWELWLTPSSVVARNPVPVAGMADAVADHRWQHVAALLPSVAGPMTSPTLRPIGDAA
eukprot:5355595-Pleurochrysis_carterae.AAC.3